MIWDFTPAEGPSRVRAEMAARGFATTRLPPELVSAASRDAWGFAEALFGERPELIECQPIRAVSGGRSFASGSGPAPLHTDSQMHLGVPAHAQVLVCVRPADRGGASLLLDTWSLVARVRAEDPALFAALLETPRALRFYFGEVEGPTWSLRGGSLAFTHPPAANDPIAERLRPYLTRAPVLELTLGEREALVVDNHRMLHGRRAFEGPRELARVLAWLPSPPCAHPDLALRAALRDRATPIDPRARERIAIVLAMLRGVPPGVLAARAGVDEAVLYRWRDAALRGAGTALAEVS